MKPYLSDYASFDMYLLGEPITQAYDRGLRPVSDVASALYIVLCSVSGRYTRYPLTLLVCRLTEWRRAIKILLLRDILLGSIYYRENSY